MRLETGRLILRPWTEGDAKAMYMICQNPNIGPMAGWTTHQSAEESRQIILEHFLPDNGVEDCAVTLKDGTLIGSFSLKTVHEPVLDFPAPRYELGYWLGEEYWGQGYMPEAARAVIDEVFSRRNALAIYVGHFDFNGQSRRVIEKLGFTYRGEIVKNYEELNREITVLQYELKREDWKP